MRQKTINSCIIFVLIIVFSFLSSSVATILIEKPDEVISEEELLPEETPDISNGFGQYNNAIDCYLASIAVMKDKTNYSRSVSGDVTAKASFISVKQKMQGYIKVEKNGDVYFEEVTYSNSSYSSSNAIKSFMKKNATTIDVVTSSKVNSNFEATYKDEMKNISLDEYKEKFGYLPLEEVHIVSNKTLKRVSEFEFDGEVYSLTIELKATAATAGYKKKIKKAAGASNLTYRSCTINAVIDKNGLVQQVRIKEKYKVTVGLEADVASTITINYAYN